LEQLIETYLAHITEDGRIQSCQNHLLGTAKLAQSFAENIAGISARTVVPLTGYVD
jgi:hypothetical protein